MKSSKFRDLTLIDINDEKLIVISCDSCGGIGEKENDFIKVSSDLVGYYTAFVALSEIIAIGATPLSIINTLAVEMNDTGIKIIEGIKKIMKYLNLNEENIITGSTEENIPVCQTGIGITVIGEIEKSKFEKIKTKRNSIVVAIGNPKIGNEILNDYGKEILTIDTLIKLKEKQYIQELLPVGSKGILFECNEIAKTNKLSFELFDNVPLDIHKSGGPSTCAIVSIEEKFINNLRSSFKIPINIIGKLY